MVDGYVNDYKGISQSDSICHGEIPCNSRKDSLVNGLSSFSRPLGRKVRDRETMGSKGKIRYNSSLHCQWI